MEYVRGETLDVIGERNKHFSPVRLGRLLGQLCEVLQAAHSQGIVHRDLKPSNLMLLDADTPYEKIKVLDFGLAKLIDAPTLRKMADTGVEMVIGTPAYMCPELVRGEEADHRGDIYSVGVILYELLTGRLPFEGMSTMDVLLAHAADAPPAMSDGKVWVPPPIEAVVKRCLAKDPEDRPASAWELAQQYEKALTAEAEQPAEENGEVVDAETIAAPPLPDPVDPSMVIYQMQAWLPQSVAAYKLRGFIHDAGGEVVESKPGKIRVRLGRHSPYVGGGRLAWLGLGGRSRIEMELHLHEGNSGRQNNLWVTVILRSLGRSLDREHRARCDQIYGDLRAYLIGTTTVAK
jgi:serine/threonine-protein kinase